MIIPHGEKIIETKKCRISGKEFFVTDKDLEFYDKVSPVFAWNKYLIPSPTLCPEERRKRRLCFYNQNSLYKNTCAVTGKEIISRIPPESGLTVFSIDAWSDRSWDVTQFGMVMNFDKSFFEQIHQLIRTTPYQNLIGSSDNITNNALYTNYTADLKNCYFLFNASRISDGYYSTDISESEWCVDCLSGKSIQHSYECVGCEDIHSCFWCQYMTNCRDCHACNGLQGCHNCLACINLSHKKYHVLNHEVSEKEYTSILWQYLSDDKFRNIIHDKYKSLCNSVSFPSTRNLNAKGSIGDTLYNVDNCTGFNITSSTNCHYCETITDSHNLADISYYGHKSEYMYESVSVGRFSQNIFFSSIVGKGNNITYCLEVKKSENCFGCVNAHYIKNCILNKPYSVQEYESLCGKIIDHMRSTGEWWEFFPHELSPFGYNETVAQEYFPLTESEVKSHGWNWHDEPVRSFEGASLTPLPISQYDEKKVGYDTAQENIDTLLAGIVQCEVTGKPFKIIRQELAFYIEHSLPVPTKHPDRRHKERMDLRNPRTLYERTCSECGTDMITTYSPERPERVVCEECYRKLVY